MLFGPGVTDDTNEKTNRAEKVASVIAWLFRYDLQSVCRFKERIFQRF